MTFDFRDLSLVDVEPPRAYEPTVAAAPAHYTVDLLGDPDTALSLAAHGLLVDRLKQKDNRPNQKHKVALLRMLSLMTRQAFGAARGRVPVPLPTGMGKTQGFVAWAAAADKRGFFDGTSGVALAAMRVEALIDLLQDLVDAGVPREHVGLMHKLKYDVRVIEQAQSTGTPLPSGYASMPPDDDAADRPILLATQASIRRGNLRRFSTYLGTPRKLLVWDEALIKSDAKHLDFHSLKFALRPVLAILKPDGAAAKYLTHAEGLLDSEITRLKNGGKQHALTLSQDLLEDAGRELEELRRHLRFAHQQELVADVLAFVELAENPLTVSLTAQGGGLITYEITVPAELDSIVILDASWPIRRLAQYDSTIEPPLALPQALKGHGDVLFNFVRVHAGRNSVRKSVAEKGVASDYVQFVVEVLTQTPPDEGVIIFGYKQIGRINHVDLIRRAIREAGIPVDECLADGSRRINFLTWGQETSRSNLSYCANVIFAGIPYRAHLDLAAYISGQADQLLFNPTSTMIEEVLLGEVAHSIYQATNRAACRRVANGEAHRTKVWLPIADDRIRPLLEAVMPGMRWKQVFLQTLGKATLTEAIAAEIAAVLAAVSSSRCAISVRELRASLPALTSRASGSTIKAATQLAAAMTGWEQRGRTLYRVS